MSLLFQQKTIGSNKSQFYRVKKKYQWSFGDKWSLKQELWKQAACLIGLQMQEADFSPRKGESGQFEDFKRGRIVQCYDSRRVFVLDQLE
jgi:hypothetical protein